MIDFLIGLLLGVPIGFLIGLYLRDEFRWLATLVRRRWH
jgi:hypothetical protein